MQSLRGTVKCVSAAVLFIAMTGIFSLTDAQAIHAQVKSESITGTVYQLAENGYYDIASASQSSSTEAAVTDGKFNIAGNISSVTTKNGFPAYSVAGGTLTFSYNYDDGLLKASKDEEHLVDDTNKVVNGRTLATEVEKGALIVQTSKDGKIWFDVAEASRTDIFEDHPDGLKDFYVTTDVQMLNGSYYRVLIAYKTEKRTQKAQLYPPRIESFAYKKYVEAYCFYAYDEKAIEVSVPENKNRRNLGSKVRTQSEGYAGSASMDNSDPHFGWEIGQFFVGGFTDYENSADGSPIFLKNNGDKISLWFELRQDIDKCYKNSAIKVIADTKGSDAEFEVPGGVNETVDFGRGALIIRKTNPDGTKEAPQIYTNYLEASASTDAVTKVDLLEEGDYEVALDYAVKFDKTIILGKSVLPETAKYRIAFKFSVRNGNSMIFLFDKGTGTELSSGSITENGFRLDFANSKYLRVNVKREVLKDGFDGLEEDTRFNSVATDGDEFTDEGVYTLTITNRDLANIDPTVKRVYVGTDNVLKAYMVNNIPISEIKEMVALGATIANDGTIIEPVTETLTELNVVGDAEESGENSESRENEDSAGLENIEEQESDILPQNEEVTAEQTENVSEQTNKKSGTPVLVILCAVAAAVIGGLVLVKRKKK